MAETENTPKIVKERSQTYFVPYKLWFEYNDPANITEDFIKEQRKLVEECEIKNKEIEEKITNRAIVVRQEIKAIYKEHSKMYKYFKNNASKEFPKRPTLLDTINNLQSKYNKIQDEKKKQEDTIKQEHQQQIYLQEAVEFLLARGKNLGTDFTFENATKTADCLRFDELVAEKVKDHEENGTLFGFGGDDNCEGCGGWDGSSRRCECGNRRVSWEQEGDFKNMYIYGEAW